MTEVILFNDINGLVGFGRYAGPYRIATELRNNGYSVQVVEFFASLTIEEMKTIIDKFVTDETIIVGLGATLWTKHYSDDELLKIFSTSDSLMQAMNSSYVELFPQNEEFIETFFSYIKNKNSKVKIVVGGHKAQNLSKKYWGVDFYILGQGEASVLALANHLKFGSHLNFVETTGGNIITENMYPYHNFSCSKITWKQNDFLFPNESVPIETARGCVFKCSFCAFNLNGKKFGDYNKNSMTLTEEFIYNYENYGITNYMISDDTLNDSVEKIDYLYNTILNLPFRIKFSAYCRLDIIAANFDMAKKLHEMGLNSVNFGIETFNPKTAKYIGKAGNSKKLQETLYKLKDLWKDDVLMSAGFIVGLPYETTDSIRNTFNFLYSKDNPLTGIGVYRYFMESPKAINLIKNNNVDPGLTPLDGKLVWNNISKIRKNPNNYTYKTGDHSWENETMNVKIAEELVSEFYTSSLAPQKYSMTYFQDYNRILNLGFSTNQVRNMYYNNIDDVKQCISKRKKMREIYMEKLLF